MKIIQDWWCAPGGELRTNRNKSVKYVHPEYGVLDNFISKMTGIHNDQIKHAPVIQEALQRLLDWIGDREYQCLRGAIRIISS